MRSLKLLGIAAPDPPGTETNPVAEALDRLVCERDLARDGLPVRSHRSPRAPRLAKAIAEHEVAPQVGYHERNARADRDARPPAGADRHHAVRGDFDRVGRDPRRPRRSTPAFVNRYGNWFTLVSAGFPGARHGGFRNPLPGRFRRRRAALDGDRRHARQIDEELRKDVSLSRAADLTEQAARIMLVRPRRMAAGQPAARPVGRLAAFTKLAMASTSAASTGSDGSA